jgi:hypothetical protein
METGAEHTDGPGETKRFDFRIFPWGLNSSNNRENTKKSMDLDGFGWIWMDIDRFGWV